MLPSTNYSLVKRLTLESTFLLLRIWEYNRSDCTTIIGKIDWANDWGWTSFSSPKAPATQISRDDRKIFAQSRYHITFNRRYCENDSNTRLVNEISAKFQQRTCSFSYLFELIGMIKIPKCYFNANAATKKSAQITRCNMLARLDNVS